MSLACHCAKILQELAGSGFKFQANWAAVLPGSTEGIYSFVAANYATGALQRAALAAQHIPDSMAEPERFTGVLELGGASLQVHWLLNPQADH